MSPKELSFRVRSASIITTRVFGFGGNERSSGGAGSLAAKRLGFSGVTTMKMISTTNKTSISGVTFMNGVGLVWVWRQADIASSPQELPQTWRSDPALHSVCIGFLDTL